MQNGLKIIIGAGVIAGVIYLVIKYKKLPAVKAETKQQLVNAVINGEQKQFIAPVPITVSSASVSVSESANNTTPAGIPIPEIPTTYADGTQVPAEVLQNQDYINAWNAFYANTIFPPGDPRNTPTPSGGILIGDGNGGFWDPNA